MIIGVLLLEGVTPGEQLKLTRIALRLRQSDVSYLATRYAAAQGWHVKVGPQHVSYLERDWKISHRCKSAILAVLGVNE
jgi:hypothetical protein